MCCIVRNENIYLPEWIRYHAKLGVEKFIIYDNDSDIPVSSELESMIETGLVSVELIHGQTKQFDAYNDCLSNYGSNFKWLAFIDPDEFLVPRTHNDLRSFMQPYEQFGGLGVNWLVFGSSGHVTRPAALQIESYLLRSNETNEINTHVKSIVQPKYTVSVGRDPHHFLFKNSKYCVNENFIPFSGPFSPHSSKKIALNHYFLRSKEEFQIKIDRGRADSPFKRTMQEFIDTDRGCNEIQDKEILRFLPLPEL